LSRITLLLLSFMLCSMCGCQRDVGEGDANSDADRVALALNWFPEAEHGGYYAAEVHGFFEQEGVDVEILPGGPGAPVIQQVATGRVAFAIANADQVLLGREQGAPIVAVMAALQDSPRCIMVHESSGIESLRQLKKLTLSVGSGKPFAKYLLSQLGDADLTIVPYQGNVTAFLQQDDVAQQAYVFSEPFIARQQGAKPRCLMLSEIGFNPYTSMLITSEQLIAADPELVAKVVRASVRGWSKYLETPAATNQKIHTLNSGMSLEILAFGADAMHPLCLPAGAEPQVLGTMTATRWETLASQLQSIGLLEEPSVWQQAFDVQFLQ
jgi:NitT/TauT family transport system substrate-binding protein